MTQLIHARNGTISAVMKRIAQDEQCTGRILCERIRNGSIVIPLNKKHSLSHPCGIGKGLRTKVNANIGTSTDKSSIAEELRKLRVAVEAGADTVMDLSVGGDLEAVRNAIIKESPVPVGTVPVYEVSVRAAQQSGGVVRFEAGNILDVLKDQAAQGVDFFTIHAGVTRKSLSALSRGKRLLPIVSRGGALIARWMSKHKKENPFYTHFDDIVSIAREYDVTLSLGDGLRPGSIIDATDAGQLAELHILGELCRRARAKGVQVMIEGPGHVPLNQIEKNIRLEKKICRQAPFYVLGPLVTDCGAGHDHITAAIGGAIAAAAGADFLCYVTPAEHLRLPSLADVRDGVIASRIAAHAADIVKGIPGALERDKAMSVARQKRDWRTQVKLALDPRKALEYRMSSQPHQHDVCTMCGDFCSLKMVEKCT